MEFEDGYQLTEEEIAAAGPVVEAGPSIVVPRSGGRARDANLFEWDGQQMPGKTLKLAVIRPCVSRGKRIRGLPPIYTQEMLRENCAVYSGWLQYIDHASKGLREALEEALREDALRDALREAIAEDGLAALLEGSRSVLEIGGRILRSWWEPSYRAQWDDERGYRQGSVMAEALPQPVIRSIVEADPEVLNVSHNAWPSGGTVGSEYGTKGVIIEGIKAAPEGSVDYVPRGGAGGQIAEATVELAVSSLRSTYASQQMPDWSNIKDPGKLIEELKANAPALLEGLGGEEAVRKLAESKDPPASGGATLTADDVARIVSEKLSESQEETVEEAAERILEERAASQDLATYAHELIEGAGLPDDWQADLKRRYAVLPSGPTDAIRLAEAEAEKKDDLSERDAVKNLIEKDLKHAAKLIESSGGTVQVRGLGPAEPDPEADESKKPKDEKVSEATESWLEGIGGLGRPLKEGEKASDLVSEMLSEGVRN